MKKALAHWSVFSLAETNMAAMDVNIGVKSAKMDSLNIIDTFFESKKNSNCLLKLEEQLLSTDDCKVLSSIGVAQDLFIKILDRKMLSVPQDDVEDEVHQKYRLWLNDRYQDILDHLINYLQNDNISIQEAALVALMGLLKAEFENSLQHSEKRITTFPFERFQKIINELVSQEIDQEDIISKFETFSAHDDLKVHTLRAVLIAFEKSNKVSNVFLNNCFNVMCAVQFESKTETPNNYLTLKDVDEVSTLNEKIYNEKVLTEIFSSVWLRFLKYKLPLSLYRNILLVLCEDVLPYINKPCMLTDFLTESYNKGGITSLLSLNSLYYLMQKYNVDYPDFYQKLYALFTVEVIESKFKADFFALSNVYLSSTHLPACLVAAFVKRLSRLALVTGITNIIIIMNFVCNLLIRHPVLKVLIHRPDEVIIVDDPYNDKEVDPTKSNALESSLWEIKTLQHHNHPDVAKKARFINRELPKVEFNASKLLEKTINDLYEHERKKRIRFVPMAFEKIPDDDLWTL